MKLLLDTHFLVWLIEGAPLRPQELSAISNADQPLLVSAISIWELRIKWSTRRRPEQRKSLIRPDHALSAIDKMGWELVSLNADDCAIPLVDPCVSSDPFDEMLLVHAQRLGARLLTRDRKLAAHPLSLPL